ncbi:hypothetical protein HMF8227_01539 [Saliniradius amylolyticus]|uniref:Uncharacterized protein n=1 Tax=Saliniradius amylolyticus TaxID=2183582 RepID=A0A2S2E303_9ALTE|nr:hypothetical protein [Saliniradius amylolyticus]AWL12013.1 hypothetical protein HMF8227_01539 [Saliniradius amylolyticus]
MPDLATIGTVLSNVKTATDLAKLIKDSQLTLNEAETKLKIADLISTLADVRLEMAEVQQALLDKDSRIKELEEILQKKRLLEFDGKLYRAEGDDVPFCPVCYEKDDKTHHLSYAKRAKYTPSPYHYCKICNNKFYQ